VGFLGLFLGAIILSITYKLLIFWLELEKLGIPTDQNEN